MAINFEPDNVDAHFCLAVFYDRYDMFDEAVSHYLKALAYDPVHKDAIFNLGNLYIQMGDYHGAIKLLQRLLKLEPTNTKAWNNIGSLYEEIGNIDMARDAWQGGVKFDPVHEEMNVNLARIEYALWKSNPNNMSKDQIRSRLQFVLALYPQNAKAIELLKLVEKG
jgi:tetratricopeptide (TPR) repeat protein